METYHRLTMAEGEKNMKTAIQPEYKVAKVTCSTCGNEFEVGSTLGEIKIDTCANCHPFYTGQQTFVQAQGRVDRFNRRAAMKNNQANKEENK